METTALALLSLLKVRTPGVWRQRGSSTNSALPPARNPHTHLTFAATEDIASLLRFFLLDTAVPMLKWKRPRRDTRRPFHTLTGWGSGRKEEQTPRGGGRGGGAYKSCVSRETRRSASSVRRGRAARDGCALRSARLSAPRPTEPPRKETQTIKGKAGGGGVSGG